MADELLVPEDAVREYLGHSKLPSLHVGDLGLSINVNVGLLSMAGQKWANVRDVERMLRAFAANDGIPLLNSIADQLVGASGLEPKLWRAA